MTRRTIDENLDLGAKLRSNSGNDSEYDLESTETKPLYIKHMPVKLREQFRKAQDEGLISKAFNFNNYVTFLAETELNKVLSKKK